MNHSVFRNQVKNVARSLVAQEADGGRKGGTLNQVAINTSRRSMDGAGERLGPQSPLDDGEDPAVPASGGLRGGQSVGELPGTAGL